MSAQLEWHRSSFLRMALPLRRLQGRKSQQSTQTPPSIQGDSMSPQDTDSESLDQDKSSQLCTLLPLSSRGSSIGHQNTAPVSLGPDNSFRDGRPTQSSTPVGRSYLSCKAPVPSCWDNRSQSGMADAALHWAGSNRRIRNEAAGRTLQGRNTLRRRRPSLSGRRSSGLVDIVLET